jgi:hypothetical protein
MAADVVFTAESPWYTNSYTWNKITEYAKNRQDEPSQGRYQEYLDVLGIDFTFLPDDKAVEIAQWLSELIGRMLAEDAIGPSEADRAHAQELVSKLNSEIQTRNRSS